MTTPYEDRQARGTALCRRLADDVGSLCPPGIGGWEEAWIITGPPSADFLDALAVWERVETEEARVRVRGAYDAVLAAWKAAVARWLGVRAEVGEK